MGTLGSAHFADGADAMGDEISNRGRRLGRGRGQVAGGRGLGLDGASGGFENLRGNRRIGTAVDDLEALGQGLGIVAEVLVFLAGEEARHGARVDLVATAAGGSVVPGVFVGLGFLLDGRGLSRFVAVCLGLTEIDAVFTMRAQRVFAGDLRRVFAGRHGSALIVGPFRVGGVLRAGPLVRGGLLLDAVRFRCVCRACRVLRLIDSVLAVERLGAPRIVRRLGTGRFALDARDAVLALDAIGGRIR